MYYLSDIKALNRVFLQHVMTDDEVVSVRHTSAPPYVLLRRKVGALLFKNPSAGQKKLALATAAGAQGGH